jgi:hypothetical protein
MRPAGGRVPMRAASPQNTLADGGFDDAAREPSHFVAGNQALLRTPGAPRPPAMLRPSRAPLLQRKCACGGSSGVSGQCTDCREEQQSALHRKAAGEAASELPPPIVHRVLASSGAPLDAQTRGFMEPRFGQDLGAVRLHTDAMAAQSAAAVNARAFTVGRDIVFASGQHAPASAQGRTLLAHELTHVVQQGGRAAPSGALRIASAEGALEQDANSAAEAVVFGKQVTSLAQPVSGCLQRQTPAAEPDRIHDPMIEQFRRENGFPPGGVDETGRRVGPSDSEIKYQLLPNWLADRSGTPRVKNCPFPSDFESDYLARMAMMCVSTHPGEAPSCTLTAKHNALLDDAKTDARRRVQKAYSRMYMVGGAEYAQTVAGRIFGDDKPPADKIKATLDAMKALLESGSLPFVGGTCADKGCDQTRSTPDTDNAHALAYESGPGKPVTICPRSFLDEYLPEFRRTVIHEVVHLAGIDVDPDVKEKYCPAYTCDTRCHDATVADAWALFVDCLGGSLPQTAPAPAPKP